MGWAQAFSWSVSALAATGLAPAGAAPEPPPADVVVLAVIVHPQVPVDDVTVGELRRLFLGDRQFWTRDLPVKLFVPPPRSRERGALLERVYQKTEAQYRHYWIAKVFRTEATAAPKVVPGAPGELVSDIAGALTVVDARRVPRRVKVLTVDGKAPARPDYPLR